jgi:hypothetical protein
VKEDLLLRLVEAVEEIATNLTKLNNRLEHGFIDVDVKELSSLIASYDCAHGIENG